MTHIEVLRRIAAKDARYAAYLPDGVEPLAGHPEELQVVLPCDYLGRPTQPPAGKDVRRRWSLCEHPSVPLGEAVCSCLGCGPKCSGYAAEA